MKGRVSRPSRSCFRTLTIIFTTLSRQSELMMKTKGDKNLYMTFEQIGALYNVTFPAKTD